MSAEVVFLSGLVFLLALFMVYKFVLAVMLGVTDEGQLTMFGPWEVDADARINKMEV